MNRRYRKTVIAGNWKMNMTATETKKFAEDLKKIMPRAKWCDTLICVPACNISTAMKAFKDLRISVGAENVYFEEKGAYTGEVSADMLKDLGVKYVIIGHSERRTYHKESDELIAKKFAVLKEQGLTPVLCIGETEAENEAGKTEEVCARQIDAVLKTQGAAAFEGVVIAYEPVWAIGTGKSATPAQAQAVHKFIRDHIAKADAKIAEQVIIQYGGSVNAGNAAELFTQPDIDGALVGGASLKADAFAVIVKAAEAAKKA